MHRPSARVRSIVVLLSLASGDIAFAQGVDEPKAAAFAFLDGEAPNISRVNRRIWEWAEVGLQEQRSSKELQSWLRANGFTIDAGVAGMPTAFVASFGQGRPIIGLLAEYDALPGMSQTDAPLRTPRAGAEAGHACGHSLLGTASTAAAIALKRAIAAGHVKGTVRLYGTPAEETGTGKTYMLRDGVFQDADAILTWHPRDATRVDYGYTKAFMMVRFAFAGLAAHASSSPHDGRSALDAVELMSVGVNYMREHIKPDARVHYVITNGGAVPNVVPQEAEVWYAIRSDRHTDLEGTFTWVKEIAEGAARMSQTTLREIRIDTALHEVLPNRTLAEALQANLVMVGPPRFTDAERAFARATQASVSPAPFAPLATGIEPLPAEPTQGLNSSDVGDVSWHVPVGSLYVAAYAAGAPGHSWQIAATTGTSIGDKAGLVAAKTLAGAALDLMRSPQLVAAAKAELAATRKALPFTSLIPRGQRARVPADSDSGSISPCRNRT